MLVWLITVIRAGSTPFGSIQMFTVSMLVIHFIQLPKISNIRSTKSQTSNISRLGLQLSLCNILKPGVNSRMKMYLEQRWQAMLQLHLSDLQLYCLPGCSYIRDLTILNTWKYSHSSNVLFHRPLNKLLSNGSWQMCFPKQRLVAFN